MTRKQIILEFYKVLKTKVIGPVQLNVFLDLLIISHLTGKHGKALAPCLKIRQRKNTYPWFHN